MRQGARCKVCLVPHDAAIHAATVSVHGWLRALALGAGEPVGPGAPHDPAKAAKRRAQALTVRGRRRGQPCANMAEVTVARVRALRNRGMTVKEVAKECGCSINAVYVRLRRGRTWARSASS